MPSLSEILRSKTESNQQRTADRKAERENLSTLREGALNEVTSNPQLYANYLTLQGDNIGCSAGNVAMTLFQLREPTKIGIADYWHQQGRYVNDADFHKGAQVFVPPRNPQYRGYFVGEYYDVSQTNGKPLAEIRPLAENDARMDNAIAALLDTSPVAFAENTELETPVRYNDRECVLEVNTKFSKPEVFAALATEITYARIHDRGRNRDFDREMFKLDAESVGYMVCRRFGVDSPRPDTTEVKKLYEGYGADDRSKALDRLRQTARNMGDTVERTIAPRQQMQTNNRNRTSGGNRRQYAMR